MSEWVDVYGLTHPVVADPSYGYGWNFMSGALPAQTLLGPGAVLEIIDGYPIAEADVEGALPE